MFFNYAGSIFKINKSFYNGSLLKWIIWIILKSGISMGFCSNKYINKINFNKQCNKLNRIVSVTELLNNWYLN